MFHWQGWQTTEWELVYRGHLWFYEQYLYRLWGYNVYQKFLLCPSIFGQLYESTNG